MLDVVAVSEQSTTDAKGELVVTLTVSPTASGYGLAMELGKLTSQSVNVANLKGEVLDTGLVVSTSTKYSPGDGKVVASGKVVGGPRLQKCVGKVVRLEAAQLGMEVEKAIENLRPKKGSGIDSVTISDSTGRSATLKPRED